MAQGELNYTVADVIKYPRTIYAGEVAGVATNAQGHIFVYQRAGTPWVALAAAVVTVLAMLYATSGGPVLAILGLGLAAWVGMATLVELAERLRLFRIPLADSVRRAAQLPRSAYGMTFAHFGLAVSVAGFAASAFDREAIEVLRPGQSMTLAGYEVRLEKVSRVQGANYIADDATVLVLRDGTQVAELHPQRRFFPVQRQTTSDTAIRTNLMSDFYVALGEADGAGAWTIRAYWKPLVPWIWIGAVIMAGCPQSAMSRGCTPQPAMKPSA